jgi:hypothetical protein
MLIVSPVVAGLVPAIDITPGTRPGMTVGKLWLRPAARVLRRPADGLCC